MDDKALAKSLYLDGMDIPTIAIKLEVSEAQVVKWVTEYPTIAKWLMSALSEREMDARQLAALTGLEVRLVLYHFDRLYRAGKIERTARRQTGASRPKYAYRLKGVQVAPRAVHNGHLSV